MKFEWKVIAENRYSSIFRAKVFGGWILNSLTRNPSDNACCESMVFIPDHEHKWEIEK